MKSIRSVLVALGVALSLAGAPQTDPPAPPIPLLPGQADLSFLGSFIKCANYLEKWVGPNIPDWVVHSSPLSYTARKPMYDELGNPLLDEHGEQRTTQTHQSGRIFFPPAWRMGQDPALPIIIYSHATTIKKDAVPSGFGGHEWTFGAAAAAYYGFAVAMPDQPGMGGDSVSYHPYCHGKSLAYAIVDAIPAIKDRFQEDPYVSQHNYRWDGRLFLMGYSEGGYASLAAAREMETHREAYGGDQGFMLTGSACMAGPFDLSGTLRKQVLEEATPAPNPFFLPYFVLGYQAVYGAVFDPLETLAPSLITTMEDGNILEWADGSMDFPEFEVRLTKRLGASRGGVVLRTVLNPAWVEKNMAEANFATSPIRGILMENDVWRDWAPTRPILLGQSPDDRSVPVHNALLTYEALGNQIRKAGRNPEELLSLRLLGEPGGGITHALGVVPAIAMALDWIYRGMPPEFPAPSVIDEINRPPLTAAAPNQP